MAQGLVEKGNIQNIANAIRSKLNSQNTFTVANMANNILNIPTSSGGGDVKKFATIEQMNQSSGNKDGDLAIIYNNDSTYITETINNTSGFNMLCVKNKVILDEEPLGSKSNASINLFNYVLKYDEMNYGNSSAYMYKSGSKYYINITVMESSGWGEESPKEVYMSYSSDDGLEFNLQSCSGTCYDGNGKFILNYNYYVGDADYDWGSGTVTLTRRCDAEFIKVFQKFLPIGDSTFGGLFTYKNTNWNVTSAQLSVKPDDVLEGDFYGTQGVGTGTLKDVSSVDKGKLDKFYTLQNLYSNITLAENASNMFKSWNNKPFPNVVSLTNQTTDISGCFNFSKLNDSVIENWDIANWDLSNVTNMYGAFGYCNISNFDVSNWNVSKVTNMDYAFSGTNPGLIFSNAITNWNVSNITSMDYMFSSSNIQGDVNLTNWNVSNVTSMNHSFAYCKYMTKLNISGWYAPKMNKLSTLIFIQNLPNQDQNVNFEIDMSNCNFSNVQEINELLIADTPECRNSFIVNLENITFGNIYGLHNLFSNFGYNFINLSGINLTSNVDMAYCFNYCRNAQSIYPFTNRVINVNNLRSTFAGCREITELNISNWNLSKLDVYSYSGLSSTFAGCENLIEFRINADTLPTNTNWSSSSLTATFQGCNNLSDASIQNIINMIVNIRMSSNYYMNLNPNHSNSPFRYTNIVNTRYENRWDELTAAGWKF